MELNKKGMFFTLATIALLSLFFASYTVYSYTENRETINNRITTMNNFVLAVDEDLPRKLYIAGFRIIFLFEKEITQTGKYITNLNTTFEEAFFNGTINTESQELLNKVTFSEIENALNENAQKVNVNLQMLNPTITISQESPWEIKMTLNTNLIIEDQNHMAIWDRNATVETFIPIENLEDPLYIINTQGLIAQKINQTPYKNFIDGSDVTNLTDHLENSYYINSTSAPSFLDRLQGINSPNKNGIESLVHLQKLSNQGITVKDKTIVDYIYFSNNNPTATHISNMESWVKLDNEHINIYD